MHRRIPKRQQATAGAEKEASLLQERTRQRATRVPRQSDRILIIYATEREKSADSVTAGIAMQHFILGYLPAAPEAEVLQIPGVLLVFFFLTNTNFN